MPSARTISSRQLPRGTSRGSRPIWPSTHPSRCWARQFLDALVVLVGNVDVALAIDGQGGRRAELPGGLAFRAELGNRTSIAREHLDTAVALFDDPHVARAVEGEVVGLVELAQ